MDEEKELVVQEPTVGFGSLEIRPKDVVATATAIATELAKVIKKQKLFSIIKKKEYVRVEGWTTLGAMLGVTPREVSNDGNEDGIYVAVVELVRNSDGVIIGRASAECGGSAMWAGRDAYARRSMATTRATGKAYRLAFSWIMALAGYEVTPAEEMDFVDVKAKETKSTGKTDHMTEYHAYARKVGVDNDMAVDILAQCGGDPEVGLQELKDHHTPKG